MKNEAHTALEEILLNCSVNELNTFKRGKHHQEVARRKLNNPIKISLIFRVFSKPLPGTVFRGSRCRSLLKNWIWIPVLDFQDFQKDTFRTNFSAQKVIQNNDPSYQERACRDPAFHETIVITIPLGPTGFYKVFFFKFRLTHFRCLFFCVLFFT